MDNSYIAKKFAEEVTSAVMKNGERGIRYVATQYIFGEKKMFASSLLNKKEESKISFINDFVSNVKSVYVNGGQKNVESYLKSCLFVGNIVNPQVELSV